MPQLVLNPGTPQAKEYELKQGTNYIGRGFANDFQIDDGSVSTRHCQITVNGNQVHFQDLRSTNGSCLNGTPVQEATLQPGQRLRLGGVEFLFQDDAVGSVSVESLAMTATPVAVAMSVGGSAVATAAPVAVAAPASGLRISRSHAEETAASASPAPAGGLRVAGLAPTVAAPPPPSHEIPTPPLLSSPVARPGGKLVCKYHPKSTARWSCPKCGQVFCDLCVSARSMGSESGNFCRKCAVLCNPVEVAIDPTEASRKSNFFAQLGGAFGYPFRRGGMYVLVGGTLFFTLIQSLATFAFEMHFLLGVGFIFALWLEAISLGYLYGYMQNVIHVTADGDVDEPSLPEVTSFWQDIMAPCFQLIGILLLCFGPTIGAAAWAASNGGPVAALLAIPAILFGCVYFPMAILSATMLGSITAINPLVVIPAIAKVPLQYFVAFLVLGGVFLVRWAGAAWLPTIIPVRFVPGLISSFVGLYFLTVECRVLGLLYYANKQKIGWFNR
ncbi:FHA domain-containing protein [Pedosphaera parvula]|nr:FHA domain-containing protein [Pedosphaera parvula]